MPKFSVPKNQIRLIVGNLHVGKSAQFVAQHISERCDGVNLTMAQRKACCAYALKCHQENQKLYHAVMTGRF